MYIEKNNTQLDFFPALIPFIPLITGVLGVGATVYTIAQQREQREAQERLLKAEAEAQRQHDLKILAEQKRQLEEQLALQREQGILTAGIGGLPVMPIALGVGAIIVGLVIKKILF